MKSKKTNEEINYLVLTPQKICEHEKSENGIVDLLVPKFKNKFLSKILIPKWKSDKIKIKLDEFGSETWLLIDSEKNVEQIGFKLLEKFGEKINPVNERLTKFLTQLYQYKFINFKEIKNSKEK